MKPALTLFAGACLVLVGCGPSRAEILREITREEDRLARLESELVVYDTRLAAVNKMIKGVQVKAAPAANDQQRNDEAKQLQERTVEAQQDRSVLVDAIARSKQKIADLRKQLD